MRRRVLKLDPFAFVAARYVYSFINESKQRSAEEDERREEEGERVGADVTCSRGKIRRTNEIIHHRA